MAPPEGFEPPTPRSEDECSKSAELWGQDKQSYLVILYIIFRVKITRMNKKKIIMIISYVFLSALLVIYVRSILKRDDLKIYEKKKIEVEESYSVDVTLKLINGKIINEFTKTLKNTDSVEELMKKIRSSGDISYELVKYTYGVDIESVNGIKPKDGFKWAILKDNEDITLKIDKLYLEKGKTYELKILEK